MATTYATLKTEVASFFNRNDLTSDIDSFIDLCEAEMQRELKILEFETTGTVTVTNGTGTLPTGFLGARHVSWEASPERPLTYVTPDKLETVNAMDPSYVNYYTITGSSIKTANDSSGALNLTYMARFTPLSDSNTTNAIITNHPGAYTFGTLKYAAIWAKDAEAAMGYDSMFKGEIASIIRDDRERKYAGASLAVRLG